MLPVALEPARLLFVFLKCDEMEHAFKKLIFWRWLGRDYWPWQPYFCPRESLVSHRLMAYWQGLLVRIFLFILDSLSKYIPLMTRLFAHRLKIQ